MIDFVNTFKEGHIITIEDPIEFIHQSKKCVVNQREVGGHTLSFANALRAALREDPDYILVGEMRDLETISLALTAAETGHLVFGTLHTSSAAKTITRIIDVFPENQQDRIRVQLSESIQCVIAQRLYPRKDKPGRIAAYEIMIATQAIRNLVREQKIFQIESVIQTGRQLGMQSMEQAKRKLVSEQKISAEYLQERMTLY
jgi:twitching motility protein PilT